MSVINGCLDDCPFFVNAKKHAFFLPSSQGYLEFSFVCQRYIRLKKQAC